MISGETKNSIKTYVRGAFLHSEDGFDYEQKHKQVQKEEKIVEDKIGFADIKKQIAEKKNLLKKKLNKTQKPVLIPIRDTPVEPVPQPVIQNQKCERATQEQFEYFQTYISQKQKERKFEEQEQKKISSFIKQQEQFKASHEQNPTPTISLVMEKSDNLAHEKKKKKLIRVKITKACDHKDNEEEENLSKIRVLQ